MKGNGNAKHMLGMGWRFPLGVDSRGGLAVSQHEQDIEESIRIILVTGKGERRMRPDFGCAVNDLVFAPNNATTWGLVAHHVEEALGWWEPRIEVVDIDVRPDSSDTSCVLVTIAYRVKATRDERSLVYPFYLSA